MDDYIQITWQDGTVPEVGVNGCQINDVIGVVIEYLQELNKAFPCRENSLTLTKLEEAQMWQTARTQRRVSAGIEGQHTEV